MNEEAVISNLVKNWAKSVRERNIEGIMANHHENIVMYDVPLPFQSRGLEAYRNTWMFFFEGTEKGTFDIKELNIIAGNDVAFCYANMFCLHGDEYENNVIVKLDFRLTIGFQKIAGQWWFMHEHHSIPAE